MDCSDTVDIVFSGHADMHSGHKLANPTQKILRDEYDEDSKGSIKYNIADCMYKTDCKYFVPPLHEEISQSLNEILLRVEKTRAFYFHTVILCEYAYISGYKHGSDQYIDSLSVMRSMLDGDNGAFEAVNKVKMLYVGCESNIDRYRPEFTSIGYMCDKIIEHTHKACISCYMTLTKFLFNMFDCEFCTIFITIKCDELSFIKSKLDHLAEKCNSEYIQTAIDEIETLFQSGCCEQYDVDVGIFLRAIVTIIFTNLFNLFNNNEIFNENAIEYIENSQKVYLDVACTNRKRVLLAINKLKSLL